MRRTTVDEAAPTLIIPRGTRIEVDPDGLLSIHAPGNVVVQNSGKYGTLESLGGSIRIDRGVEVEAATVRCAHTCYVQGHLTAWKVNARSLHLEDGARAHVVFQETQRLEIGRDARLVGNFSSEKELVGLFSRFANQVRSLPFFERRGTPASLPRNLDDTIVLEARPAPEPVSPSEPPPPPEAAFAELPEPLIFAMVLLERESEARIHPAASQRALDGLVKLLEQQDLETLRATYRTLFGRIAEPRQDVQRAKDLVVEYFTS
ncbi:MAG TPA: hypothetical protein VNW71_00500 [Thermoanaerobaculia bacterium]|nr:hypothetical protein [Thermoanaerobaculia bacterium]